MLAKVSSDYVRLRQIKWVWSYYITVSQV